MMPVYLIICILFVSHWAVAGTEPGLQASFADEFKRYVPMAAYADEIQSEWKVVVWRGERVNRQLLVWSDRRLKKVKVAVDDMAGDKQSISNDNIQVLHQQYIIGDPEARNCENAYQDGRDTDVILPDALSLTIPDKLSPKDPLKLWLSIDVPDDIEPGIYQTMATVSARKAKTLQLPIVIEVLDLTLPPPSDWHFYLDLWQFPLTVLDRYNDANWNNRIEDWSDEHFALLEPSYRRLANAGQKAITTYISFGSFNYPGMVKWIIDGENIHYDFSVFDRYVETLQSWGINGNINAFTLASKGEQLVAFEMVGSDQKKVVDIQAGSDIYVRTWSHFLKHFKAHLDEKGWFDKTILYMDEVPAEKMASVLEMIERSGDNWKLGLAHGHSISTETTDGLYMVSSLLGSTAQWSKDRPEKRHTFYTSCEQTLPNSYVTPDNSPAEMTWMAWHSASQNYDGYLRWAYDYWRDERPNGLHDGRFTAGDFSLVYRDPKDSANTLSSLRFEALREGIEDFEKIRILQQCENIDANSFTNILSMFQSPFTSKEEYRRYLSTARKELAELSGAYQVCK